MIRPVRSTPAKEERRGRNDEEMIDSQSIFHEAAFLFIQNNAEEKTNKEKAQTPLHTSISCLRVIYMSCVYICARRHTTDVYFLQQVTHHEPHYAQIISIPSIF